MKRVIWLVMDSFGIGNAEDAAKFDDLGSDTFGNIAKAYNLDIPNMQSLGIHKAYELNHKRKINLASEIKPLKNSFWGVAKEFSSGKDTLSGHWEMAGIMTTFNLKYFSKKKSSFPQELINEIVFKADISGIIGNRHASGIEIINSLGKEHLLTNKPIFYTSADSVIQIAAHEDFFGLERLYKLCEVTRKIVNKYSVGRVIARPFSGDPKNGFKRTKNRKDYSLKPYSDTILDIASKNKKRVISIGKIYDIFGGSGIDEKKIAYGLNELFNKTLKEMDILSTEGIIFTNFVDFDMEWGHRRDTYGYAKGLEYFDTRLSEIIDNLKQDDLLIITADHGCDPTFKGTDHTRENVPIFGLQRNMEINEIGIRNTFADIAATIEDYLDLPPSNIAKSFLNV